MLSISDYMDEFPTAVEETNQGGNTGMYKKIIFLIWNKYFYKKWKRIYFIHVKLGQRKYNYIKTLTYEIII